jgi:dTDP-glucose 4,6-dehydratase
MANVLVTGADGFIGSHLVEGLVDRGEEVRAFVRYNAFNSWGWLDAVDEEVVEAVEIFSGDVRDPNGVREAMREIDVVYHLAALISIPYSYHSPDTYVDTNVTGTLNVLQAARDLGTEKIVHTSTSEVYGSAQFVPITEDHPLQGQSPYAASKIGADQMALSFYRSFDTPVAVIRPFNTYGPRQSTRAVIPTIITQIASGRRTLELGNLHPTRDFSFVKDTVGGFMAVADADASVGEVVNVGSGFEISIGDLVDLIAETMSVDVEVETDDERTRPEKSEVDRLYADISKARELLEWEPEHRGRDGFKRGLAKTAAWFSDDENLQHYKAGTYAV